MKLLLFLYRVVGAIVIVIGLFLLIWGKKNNKSSPPVEDEAIPVKKMIEIDNKGSEHSNGEVLNVNIVVNKKE